MSSRDLILETIKRNLPKERPLPELNFSTDYGDSTEKFKSVLSGIGGNVILVNSWADINTYIEDHFKDKRVLRFTPSISSHEPLDKDPHLLEDVKLAVLEGHIGVAESGAIWITGELMGDRALPFICENLALVIHQKNIVPTLNEAYETIGSNDYNLGTFIAGPSKTADIEQSLVLGAHGPKTLIVFILLEQNH